MKKNRKLILRILVGIIMVVIVVYGVLGVIIYSSVGRYPVGRPAPPPHISSLIWPTIGYPEFAGAGGLMGVEVLLPGTAAGSTGTFTATLTPARAELDGLTYTMGATTYSRGVSLRWPTGTMHGSEQVWRAEFRLPAGAVPELYDLTVNAQVSGKSVADAQRHSVSIVAPGREGDFSFVSLADVHVHQRNVSGFLFTQTNKGIAPDGRPLFFERAIDQVNLMRPDFAVILGDCVLAQHAPGEYVGEFKWFYAELARFQVPVFVLPGNHDSYVNEVDGKTVWEENLGPLYYSFDFGRAHFLAVDTNQWPVGDRIIMEKLGLVSFPRKWQGQVLAASDERKPQTYVGQLAWMRRDLARYFDAEPTFMMMHHDPFRPKGKAISWKNERFAGVFALGGGGVGSTALKELAARYTVDYFLTGHLHSDYVGTAPWTNRRGSTAFVNQTMVYFDEGGEKDSYPGYRLWRVKDGAASGYTYLDDFHSAPLYDGCNLKGDTDLAKLRTLALSGGRTPSGFSVRSYLGVAVPVRGLIGEFPAGARSGTTGAQVYQSVPIPGNPARVLLYLSTVVPAGKPGTDPSTPGIPANETITVR